MPKPNWTRHFPDEFGLPNAQSCRSQKVGISKCKSRADRSKPVGLLVFSSVGMLRHGFGLWSVFVPPSSLGPVGICIVPGTISRGALVAVTGYPQNGAPGPGEAF